MKILNAITMVACIAASTFFVQAQTHHWHVVDNGGGKSTAGGATLLSSYGQYAVQAMTSSSVKLESGYLPGLRSHPDVTQSVLYRWNMVSVQRKVSDYRKTSLYPSSDKPAFSYIGGTYVVRDTLRNGIGYWLWFPGPDVVSFTGGIIAKETLNVTSGWNMIGVTSTPVPIATITPVGTTVTSNYFGYDGSTYIVESTLQPGKAYWVRVDQVGQLILQGGGVAVPASANHQQLLQQQEASDLATTLVNAYKSTGSNEQFHQLVVKDAAGQERSLYFSTSSSKLDVTKFDIPPTAPSSVLDVRYAANRIVEFSSKDKTKNIPIIVTSAVYPIEIRLVEDGRLDLGLTYLKVNESLKELGSGSITITDPETMLRLQLESGHGVDIPAQFALSQNYPNPFNPTTVIKYQLPMSAHVELAVYDMLGQLVATLVNNVEEAGYRSVEWNASNIASGMYFYKVVATSIADPDKAFTQVRKMVLIK